MPATKTGESARPGSLSAKDLGGLWTSLAEDDAARAYREIGTLTAAPDQAISLVRERLRPASEANGQQVARLIADLDSNQFAVRQKAREELENLGEQAAPALRKTLTKKPALAVSRQIEEVLAKTDQLTPESIRAVRAIEVLEHIGSPEAKRLLETLAKGAEGFRLTTEAKASLDRLNRRTSMDK
jgi:hypothetical protein